MPQHHQQMVDHVGRFVHQAFMSGRIKVDGDMSKMMTPQPPKNDAQKELDAKILDLTE